MTTPTLTLEETIRALAGRGDISDIGLTMNPSHTKWRAHFAPTKKFSVAYAEDEDPVKALLLALGSVRVKAPPVLTDRQLVAAEAKSTAKIEQATVDVEPDEYLAGITAKTAEDDIEALM